MWELAVKSGSGKLDLGADVRSWVDRAIRELVAHPLPISTDHAAAVEMLPAVHRDPFDRMLVAQARCEGVVLLTADPVLAEYGPTVLMI